MFSLEYLRHFRIEGFAIFDVVVSLLGVYLLSGILTKLFLKIGLHISTRGWLYFTLPIGILVHILVGQITPMTKAFLSTSGGYEIKLLILVLLFLGFLEIKIAPRR